MRFEATIPEARGKILVDLAKELGLSRSQLIDEALGLYLKAMIEARRGRRLFMIDPCDLQASCELATPTLTQLEWSSTQSLLLESKELEALAEVLDKPAKPTDSLKKTMKGRKNKDTERGH